MSMNENIAADTPKEVVVIKTTDTDKKFCERVKSNGKTKFVSDQGEVDAIDFLEQAFGNNPAGKGKRNGRRKKRK